MKSDLKNNYGCVVAAEAAEVAAPEVTELVARRWWQCKSLDWVRVWQKQNTQSNYKAYIKYT